MGVIAAICRIVRAFFTTILVTVFPGMLLVLLSAYDCFVDEMRKENSSDIVEIFQMLESRIGFFFDTVLTRNSRKEATLHYSLADLVNLGNDAKPDPKRPHVAALQSLNVRHDISYPVTSTSTGDRKTQPANTLERPKAQQDGFMLDSIKIPRDTSIRKNREFEIPNNSSVAYARQKSHRTDEESTGASEADCDLSICWQSVGKGSQSPEMI